VNKVKKDLHHQAAASSGSVGGGALAAVGAVIFPLLIGWILAVFLGVYFGKQKRKQEYHKLQKEYVLARFLRDEFEKYVVGVEACG
jgi:hypothetical protein